MIEDDAQLDALFRGLPGPEPSAALEDRVFAVFREEAGARAGARTDARTDAIRAGAARVSAGQASPPSAPSGFWPAAGGQRWVRRAGLGVALGLGISGLFLVEPPVERGDPSQMVARGSGGVQARLTLEVVVRAGERSERLRAGEAYPAGTTLVFRVHSTAEAEVALSRNGEIFYRGRVGPGESALPMGYTLEAGEGAAVFEVRAVEPAGAAGQAAGRSAGDGAGVIEIPAVLP